MLTYHDESLQILRISFFLVFYLEEMIHYIFFFLYHYYFIALRGFPFCEILMKRLFEQIPSRQKIYDQYFLLTKSDKKVNLFWLLLKDRKIQFLSVFRMYEGCPNVVYSHVLLLYIIHLKLCVIFKTA